MSSSSSKVSDFILVIFQEYNSNNATFFLLVRFAWKFGWSHLTPPACQDFAAQMLILHIFGINFTYYIISNNLLELFYWGMWSGGEDFGSEIVEHIDEKLKKVSSCPPFEGAFDRLKKHWLSKKLEQHFGRSSLKKQSVLFWASLTELGRQIVHDHFFRARATEKVL